VALARTSQNHFTGCVSIVFASNQLGYSGYIIKCVYTNVEIIKNVHPLAVIN